MEDTYKPSTCMLQSWIQNIAVRSQQDALLLPYALTENDVTQLRGNGNWDNYHNWAFQVMSC